MPRKKNFPGGSPEWVTARLPARTNAQLKLMARLSGESKAMVLVRAVASYAAAFGLDGPQGHVSVAELADPVPAQRFANLVARYPSALNTDERAFLSRVGCDDQYWNTPAAEDSAVWPPDRDASDINVTAVIRDWTLLNAPDSI